MGVTESPFIIITINKPGLSPVVAMKVGNVTTMLFGALGHLENEHSEGE